MKAAPMDLIRGMAFFFENCFVEAVLDAGLVFIGPHAKAMTLMGDKAAASEHGWKRACPLFPVTTVKTKLDDRLIDAAKALPSVMKQSRSWRRWQGMAQLFRATTNGAQFSKRVVWRVVLYMKDSRLLKNL